MSALSWASSCCCLHRRTIFDCFRVCDADSWRVSACVVWFSYTLITRGDGRLVRDPLSLISLLVSFRSLPPARSHTHGTQISSTWIGNFSVLLFFFAGVVVSRGAIFIFIYCHFNVFFMFFCRSKRRWLSSFTKKLDSRNEDSLILAWQMLQKKTW